MRLACIFAIALVASACKGKDQPAAPARASCTTPATKLCEDYEGDAAFLASRRKDCTTGTWATTACPTTNVVGSCREQHAKWTRTRHYYAGAPADLARVQAECGAFGTWLPPAAP